MAERRERYLDRRGSGMYHPLPDIVCVLHKFLYWQGRSLERRQRAAAHTLSTAYLIN